MNRNTVLALMIVLAMVVVGVYWVTQPPAPTGGPDPAAGTATPDGEAASKPDTASADAPAEEPSDAPSDSEQPPDETQADAEPVEAGFCERDFDATEARSADVEALRAAGGLVYIFEREAALDDPYGCADYYLAHGLEIDAVDPRDDHAPNPIDHRRAAAACCVKVPDERWDVISRRARSRRCVAAPRHA